MPAKPSFPLLNRRGASLLEVLAATIILSVVVFFLVVVIQKSSIETTKVKLRTAAGENATSRLEEIKLMPYATVPLTPDDLSANFAANNCDCGTVNFETAPWITGVPGHPGIFEKRTQIAGVEYRIRTCINRVTASGSTFLSTCGGTTDSGIKNIVMHTSWKAGFSTGDASSSSFKTESFISRSIGNTPVGNIQLNFCSADAPYSAVPPGPCTTPLPAPANMVVGIYSNTDRFVRTYPGTLNQANFVVPAPAVYTVQVQAPGHFPFRRENTPISASGNVSILVPMQSFANFGSRLGAEINVQNGVKISKVIAQVKNASPEDRTEVIELTNTSGVPLFLPDNNLLRMTFVAGVNPATPGWIAAGAQGYRTVNFTEAGFLHKNGAASFSVPAGGSLLIMGLPTAKMAAPATNVFAIQPDIWYDVTSASLANLIGYSGWGVQIQGTVGGVAYTDNVRWIGTAGSGTEPAPGNVPGVVWEGVGQPLPSGMVSPI